MVARENKRSGDAIGKGMAGEESKSLFAQPPAPDGITPNVTLGEDGILRIDYSAYDRITLASFEYAHARHVALCPTGKVPVLFRGKSIASAEYQAQRYISTPEVCAGISAAAIVVKSLLERHLGRMLLIYHRPPYPVQLFSDETEALAWLRQFLPRS